MLNDSRYKGDALGTAATAQSARAEPSKFWPTVRSYALWIVLPAAFGWLIDSDGVIGTAFFTVVGLSTCLAIA